jgi:putative endonuclease
VYYLSVPFFYIARCADGSLYSGACLDLTEREKKHNDGTGAKYTRSRLPVKMVYSEEFETMSEALKREAEVKRMKKVEKEKLVKRKK